MCIWAFSKSVSERFGIIPIQKNILYFVWWKSVKNPTALIGFNPLQSEGIWTKFFIRANSFELIHSENTVYIQLSPDLFALIRIENLF